MIDMDKIWSHDPVKPFFKIFCGLGSVNYHNEGSVTEFVALSLVIL